MSKLHADRITLPIILLALLSLLLCGCEGGSERAGDRVTVSGKTIYKDMAVEEVSIHALRMEDGKWLEAGRTKSKYHGSFRLDLAPGRYKLEATGTLPGPMETLLTGALPQLEVPSGQDRLDQVVIELVPKSK